MSSSFPPCGLHAPGTGPVGAGFKPALWLLRSAWKCVDSGFVPSPVATEEKLRHPEFVRFARHDLVDKLARSRKRSYQRASPNCCLSQVVLPVPRGPNRKDERSGTPKVRVYMAIIFAVKMMALVAIRQLRTNHWRPVFKPAHRWPALRISTRRTGIPEPRSSACQLRV